MFEIVGFSFIACGAPDPKWHSTQPSTAPHPEGDRAEESQGPGLRSLWNSVQGESLPHTALGPLF